MHGHFRRKSDYREGRAAVAEEELSDKIELAIQELLNVVEALSADKKSLVDEVERLRKQLEQKKKAKNTYPLNRNLLPLAVERIPFHYICLFDFASPSWPESPPTEMDR